MFKIRVPFLKVLPDNDLFKGGTYPGVTHPTTGEIFYNTSAFNGGFDKLYLTYDHELWHHRRVVSKRFQKSGNTVAKEEYLNYMRNYKRQGLYKNHKFPLRRLINNYGSKAGIDYDVFMPYGDITTSAPFWHNIYTLRRLW